LKLSFIVHWMLCCIFILEFECPQGARIASPESHKINRLFWRRLNCFHLTPHIAQVERKQKI
jgi:hypothetical protein